jgi:hypothetical protein
MCDEEAMAFGKINPPIFHMHPDEFAKQGLTKDQVKAILRLQLDLAEKITKANYDYCKALKGLSFLK